MAQTTYRNLVVTIEHAASGKMGGIGAYNAETGKLADNILFLLVDDELSASPADNIIICHTYIAEKQPSLKALYDNHFTRHYAVYKVVEALLAEHPDIKNIDTHEYSGVASKVAEAIRCGLLAPDVRIRTYCHGGHVQLERATGEWDDVPSIIVNADERSVIENADEVWFSSRYLANLYTSAGIAIDPAKLHVLGLPYDLRDPKTLNVPDFTTIKHLVFNGRMNRLKGYEIFTEVVEKLVQNPVFAEQLESVIAVGKDDGSMPEKTALLQSLASKHNFTFEQTLMTREGVLEFTMNHAHNSLFILPYMSDNYSMAMLEIVEAKAPLICLDTGGNIELVDSDIWRGRLPMTTEGLVGIAQKYMAMAPADRQAECQKLYEQFYEQQSASNKAAADRFNTVGKARVVKTGNEPTILLLGDEADSEHLVFDPVTLQAWVAGKQVDAKELMAELDANHVLVMAQERGLSEADLKVARQTLAKAVTTDGAYSVVLQENESVAHAPAYLDVDLLAFVPDQAILRNVCLPTTQLADFMQLYIEVRAGRQRRSADYFMAGLTYRLATSAVVVVPVPVAANTASVAISELVIDEALFADLAQFADPAKRWDTYRHVSHIRRIMADRRTNTALPGDLAEFSDRLRRITARGGAAAKATGLAVKIQMKLLDLVSAVKKGK